jgi:RHS repeat-associated protein
MLAKRLWSFLSICETGLLPQRGDGPEIGRSYYCARYYDSATGRFISEDPGRYTPVNFYSYAGGDPIFWNDPLGLYKCAQGAICIFIPELNQALLNFEKCVGHEVTITCGNDSHKPTDPHMRARRLILVTIRIRG